MYLEDRSLHENKAELYTTPPQEKDDYDPLLSKGTQG